MREIKFRAWDKKEKRMYEWHFITHFFDEKIRVHKEGYGYIYIPMDDIELLQFTELKDKNGKEIYEGDIVKTGNGEIHSIEWNVSWASFMFDGLEHLVSVLPDLAGVPEYKFCEVIGNIYENPELLT